MSRYKNVLDLGISTTGHPCSAALNRLLSKGNEYLEFPAGTYLIEQTLKLPSGTHIKADPQARFLLADGAATTADDYLVTNADPVNGNTDIVIEGGVWDGNQNQNPRPEGLQDVGYTGAMMHFENVRNLHLSQATLTNAEAYYARFTHVHDFQVNDILFDSVNVRKNNDGIHLGGNCSRGVIRNLRASTPGVPGDDLVALNADDALERTEVRGMTRGPIEDILIENLEARSCHTFVRLLSVTSPIRNITIRNVRGGCQVGALNADGARGCRIQVFDGKNPSYNDGVGLLENIHASDFYVHKCSAEPMALIDIQERTVQFHVENFIRNTDADRSPASPTVRFRYVNIVSVRLNQVSIAPQNLLSDGTSYEEFTSDIRQMDIQSTYSQPDCF
ncbi:MAG: glycosyl hydrolase family 28-related protein [Kiritimatiellales bacterium]